MTYISLPVSSPPHDRAGYDWLNLVIVVVMPFEVLLPNQTINPNTHLPPHMLGSPHHPTPCKIAIP